MKVTIIGGDLPQEEINAYIERAKEKYPGCTAIDIKVDGEFVDLTYYTNQPFQRIRRITGYLVGTVDRFNDAKRDEVNNRVKHMTNTGGSNG